MLICHLTQLRTARLAALRSMVDLEMAHEGCTSLRVVETMHERKPGQQITQCSEHKMPSSQASIDL